MKKIWSEKYNQTVHLKKKTKELWIWKDFLFSIGRKGIKTTEPRHEKMCLVSYVNNKGADQPVHSRSLISAFVVRCLDSVISLAEISRL